MVKKVISYKCLLGLSIMSKKILGVIGSVASIIALGYSFLSSGSMQQEQNNSSGHQVIVGRDYHNYADTSDDRSSEITISSLVAESSKLDIMVRNIGDYTSFIHKAELIIDEVSNYAYFEPRSGGYEPTSYEYNLLIKHDDKNVFANLSQSISPKGVDRFSLILLSGVLSDESDHLGLFIEPDERIDRYQGYQSPMNLLIAGFDIKAKLRLYYNEGRLIESEFFKVTVYGVWPNSRLSISKD